MHPCLRSAVLLAAISFGAASCGGDSPSAPSPVCNHDLTAVRRFRIQRRQRHRQRERMPDGTVQATLTTRRAVRGRRRRVHRGSHCRGGVRQRPALISMAFPANYDAPRDGVVMVRWPTATAGQNIRLAQAGCMYGVSTTSLNFRFRRWRRHVRPTECGGATQDRCVWTAQSSVRWIVITGSMPRAGDNPVAFTVAPNDATQPRTGQITVRDKTVTITQAGR